MLFFANYDADADDDTVAGVDFVSAMMLMKLLMPLTLMSMLTMWCSVSNLTLSLSVKV